MDSMTPLEVEVKALRVVRKVLVVWLGVMTLCVAWVAWRAHEGARDAREARREVEVMLERVEGLAGEQLETMERHYAIDRNNVLREVQRDFQRESDSQLRVLWGELQRLHPECEGLRTKE